MAPITLAQRPSPTAVLQRTSTNASASSSFRTRHAAVSRRRGALVLPHAGYASPLHHGMESSSGAAPGYADMRSMHQSLGSELADTAAEAADELQQWVRKELKKWGVEDALAAKKFLEKLNQAGLNCPMRLGVATIMYNVVPQLLLTICYVLGSIASCHAIGWGVSQTDAHMLLRGTSFALGLLSGGLYFWLRAIAAITKTTVMMCSGFRFGGRAEAFLAAVQEMANNSSEQSADVMARAAAKAVKSMQMLGKTAVVLKALSKYQYQQGGMPQARQEGASETSSSVPGTVPSVPAVLAASA